MQISLIPGLRQIPHVKFQGSHFIHSHICETLIKDIKHSYYLILWLQNFQFWKDFWLIINFTLCTLNNRKFTIKNFKSLSFIVKGQFSCRNARYRNFFISILLYLILWKVYSLGLDWLLVPMSHPLKRTSPLINSSFRNSHFYLIHV